MLAIDSFSDPTGINPVDNRISNGSFEDDFVETSQHWDIFDTLTSWTVTPTGESSTQAELQEVGLNGWSASHGNQWLELDGDETGPGVGWNAGQQGRAEQGLYTIAQDVQVLAGEVYTLSFDFAARPGQSLSENELSLRVFDGNGAELSTAELEAHPDQIVPASSAPVWRTASTTFMTVADGPLTIEFAGLGANNTFGMFLDNIVMVKSDSLIIDIDTDSDNNADLKGDEKEDDVEHDAEMPVDGKRIFINNDDDNENGIPDHLDKRDKYNNHIDNDLTHVRLKAANLPANSQLWLGRQDGLFLLSDQRATPLGDLAVGAPDDTVSDNGVKWFVWKVDGNGNVTFPKDIYVEGHKLGKLDVYWQVRVNGVVTKEDTVLFSVEKMVLPSLQNKATNGWQTQNTSEWDGVSLEPGWGINKALEGILTSPDDFEGLEMRTRHPEENGYALGQPKGKGKAWHNEGTDSFTTDSFEKFTLEFEFNLDGLYVRADHSGPGKLGPEDKKKLSFFSNSGIKIWGAYEIAIMDSRQLTGLNNLRALANGNIIGGDLAPAEPASRLMTGVAYGAELTDANFMDHDNDPVEMLKKNAARLDGWVKMKIEFQPNDDGKSYSVRVYLGDSEDPYFIDTNITKGTGSSGKLLSKVTDRKVHFQNHWDSGVSFRNVSIK